MSTFSFPNSTNNNHGDQSGIHIDANHSHSGDVSDDRSHTGNVYNTHSHDGNVSNTNSNNGNVSLVQNGNLLQIARLSNGHISAPVIANSFTYPARSAPATLVEPPKLVSVPEPSPSPKPEPSTGTSGVSAARKTQTVSGDSYAASTVAADSSGTSVLSDVASNHTNDVDMAYMAHLRRMRHLNGLQRESSRRNQHEANKYGGYAERKRGSSKHRTTSRSKSRSYGKSRRAVKYGDIDE